MTANRIPKAERNPRHTIWAMLTIRLFGYDAVLCHDLGYKPYVQALEKLASARACDSISGRP